MLKPSSSSLKVETSAFDAPSPRYTGVAIALHWLLAVALGGMIAIGKNMYDAEGRPIEWLYQLHKSVGITILILVIARLSWRHLNPPPELPEGMTPLEEKAAHWVHIGLYALMILLPLSGWVMVSVSPFAIATVLYGTVGWPHLPFLPQLAFETREAIYPNMEEIHAILSWILIALFIFHVAGAIKHEMSDEEGVIKRMVPRLFGETSPPRAPARGALTAFGSAAAFFGIIAGGPVVAQSFSGSSVQPSATSAASGNWIVDYEASEIAFSGEYNGNPYSGTFSDWTADITFDPDALETSEASVSVPTATAATGTSLYDNTLTGGEWFNVSAFPTATVALSDFAQSDSGYSATAALTIKELTVEVPFAFTLEINGNDATMTGETTLSRSALDLGQQSDPGGSWVADEVRINVTVKASRSAN
ncbi:MAG: cytochrome b/b6 domain-containing protein [Pseudomonadota bacterium]